MMGREIPLLSDLGVAKDLPASPLKVCVVSSEFLGPVKNGGIATATSALIKLLAGDGHRVTLLYTLVENGKPSNAAEQEGSSRKKSWQHWVDELARQKITLAHIPHEGDYGAYLHKSWLVKEYLSKHDFDLVYFDDWHGLAYYSVLAKRAGLAPFSGQLHCVLTHASKEWVCSVNEQHIQSVADLEVCGLERRSVELADVVIGPSRYLLREYDRYGWRLPRKIFHQQLPIVHDPITPSDETIRIDELVFFGRLETRKGLWLFCEALDRLSDRLRDKTVTFLGKTTDAGISSGLQLLNRSTKWPFRVRLLSDYDRDEAIGYLKQGNKLAVMPSLADNSPCVIHECIEAGVPFISTLGSGIQELVDPKCWPDMMFEPTVHALVETLVRVLDKGAKLGRPSIDPEENIGAWSAWHRYVSLNRAKLVAPAPVPQVDKTLARKNVGEKQVPILLTIDNGNCSLQLLAENLATHVKRLGGFATFIVLSGRGKAAREALEDLFTGAEGPAVRFLDPSEIDEARKLIGQSEFAFFMDADVEMAPTFFVLALEALARDPSAIVTCVGAIRDGRSERPQIEQLPTGDIPALSVLDRPIGGPVWAASPANLTKQFSSLEFYDKRSDALVSSWFLGDLLMSRRRMENGAVELVPIVGGTVTRNRHDPLPTKNVQEIRLTAAALDIPRSLYGGAAPWFAISAFSANSAQPQQIQRELFSALPPDHPLPVLEARGGNGDFATLAASLGRAELALQMGAAVGGSAWRVQELMDIAVDAARRRPVFDLAEVLANGDLMEFGRQSSPQRLERKTPPSQVSGLSGQAGQIGIYLESRLRVTGRKIQATATLLNGGPGKLYFMDVPLCGNSALTAKFHSGAQSPLLVRIKAIDSGTGDEMSSTFAHLLRDQAVTLSLPLYEIYGRAIFLFEFSGAAHMQVTAEKILLQ
jgi:glycosyltransferase involved in cell wall biosynthesis